MSKREPGPMFSWRTAVLASDLEATTKHVLLTLACHMNEFGESCYPTIEQLVKETSLSNRSVITHIQAAEEKGWIKKNIHGYKGQRWRNAEYLMQWPEWASRGTDPPAGIEEKVVNQVHDVSPEGGEPGAEGGEPSDRKVVNQVHSSTSFSTSNSTSLPASQVGDVRKARKSDPSTVFSDARILFHRHAKDEGWEAKGFGDLSADNKPLWAEAVMTHGKDAVLGAVRLWLEERRDMPKRFNPVGVFMKQIDEYVQMAKADTEDENEDDGYPDLAAIHRREEAERKRELAAIEEREKRKRELSESGQPRGGTTG